MLYDGTADAIRSIRRRKYGRGKNKEFTQTRCAERAAADFTLRKWNEIETGKQRCLRVDLEAVLRGLMCTEAELREEKLRLERLNHLTRGAGDIGEPRSTYGSAWGAIEVNELYALPVDELMPEHGGIFDFHRNYVAQQYAGAINAADQVKIMFENYKKKAEEARAERTEEPEETRELKEEQNSHPPRIPPHSPPTASHKDLVSLPEAITKPGLFSPLPTDSRDFSKKYRNCY